MNIDVKYTLNQQNVYDNSVYIWLVFDLIITSNSIS